MHIINFIFIFVVLNGEYIKNKKMDNSYYNVYEFDGEYLLVLEKSHLEKMLTYYSDSKNQIVVG